MTIFKLIHYPFFISTLQELYSQALDIFCRQRDRYAIAAGNEASAIHFLFCQHMVERVRKVSAGIVSGIGKRKTEDMAAWIGLDDFHFPAVGKLAQ